jgi:hypothetical protein
MPKHDFSALEAHYPEVIEQMPATFTSHQFILRLAQEQQVLYIEALYDYRDSLHRGSPAPFRAVHQTLSDRLNKYPNLVVRDGDDDQSKDIFGQTQRCAKWRKRQ